MAGSVGGVSIQLFDLNNNGKFGEQGKDGMIDLFVRHGEEFGCRHGGCGGAHA